MNYSLPILVAVTLVAWGLWGFFIKLGVEATGRYPALLIWTLTGFVTVAAAGYFLFDGSRAVWGGSPLYPTLAGVAIAVGNLAFILLLEKALGSIIIPLTSIYPAVTVVLAIVFLGEALKAVHVVGIVLAVVAVVLLSL